MTTYFFKLTSDIVKVANTDNTIYHANQNKYIILNSTIKTCQNKEMVDYIVTRKLTDNHATDLCDTAERPRIMPARFARPQFPWNT